MRYFFAGAEQNPFIKMLSRSPARRYMASLFFLSKPARLFEDKRDDKLVIVDSGGFSARVAFKNISLDAYIRFLDRFKHKSFHGKMFRCMNLDSLNLKESLANQKKLEKLGYNPLPIYHYSEFASDDREIIQDMVRDYDYIAIGGVAGTGLRASQKRAYLNYVFNLTRDKVKVHGLGMSSLKPVDRYPFYTVDSSTWLQFQKFGASRAIKDETLRKWASCNLHYEERNELEIRWYLKFERETTRIWAARGVKWDDYEEIMSEDCDFQGKSFRIKSLPKYSYNPNDRRFDQPKTVITKGGK